MGLSGWKSKLLRLFHAHQSGRCRQKHTGDLSISWPVSRPSEDHFTSILEQRLSPDLYNVPAMDSKASLEVTIARIDTVNLAAISKDKHRNRMKTIYVVSPTDSLNAVRSTANTHEPASSPLSTPYTMTKSHQQYHQGLNAISLPSSPFYVEGINSINSHAQGEINPITSFRGGKFKLSPISKTGRFRAGRSGNQAKPQDNPLQ